MWRLGALLSVGLLCACHEGPGEFWTWESKNATLEGVHLGDGYGRAWYELSKRNYGRAIYQVPLIPAFERIKRVNPLHVRSYDRVLFWDRDGSSVELFFIAAYGKRIVSKIVVRKINASQTIFDELREQYRGFGRPVKEQQDLYWCTYAIGPDCGPTGDQVDQQFYLSRRGDVVEAELIAGSELEKYWIEGRRSMV